MSSLQDKLKEIINSNQNDIDWVDVDKCAVEITDAFIADGWGIGASHVYGGKGMEQLCMTGEEWYARFNKELEGTIFGEDDALGALNTCKAAAKRASGVKI